MNTKEQLSWLLDLHSRHSVKRDAQYDIVLSCDAAVGDYHKRVISLLREKFGCAKNICHFRVDVEGKSYVLTYYPVGNGNFQLAPLLSLEEG